MFNRLHRSTPFLLGGALFAFLGAQAFSQDEVPHSVSGSAVFKTYCAVCHGKEAKGDGPLSGSLRFTPPDLTLLAKRNGGTYPSDQVFRMIDGRKPLKGHGGPDMPIWGDAFKGTADGFSEEKVKAKIDALVDFLKSIQEKDSK
jgi:mono/diheme cytochrome c family protein